MLRIGSNDDFQFEPYGGNVNVVFHMVRDDDGNQGRDLLMSVSRIHIWNHGFGGTRKSLKTS